MTPTPLARRRHHRPRLRWPVEELQPAGRVQQVGDALNGGRRRAFLQQPDDGVGMADAGQPPGADQPLGHQPLEHRTDMRDEGRVGGHADGGVAPSGCEGLVRHDIGMQEEHVEPRHAQALQAALDRPAQDGVDLAGRRVAQVALAGDADTGGQLAAERLAYDLLGLAVAVAGCEVEQCDPGSDRGMHRGDAFVERGGSPEHAEAPAAEGQGGDGWEVAELVLLHLRSPSVARLGGQICRRPQG
jgi:hypothetical protein